MLPHVLLHDARIMLLAQSVHIMKLVASGWRRVLWPITWTQHAAFGVVTLTLSCSIYAWAVALWLVGRWVSRCLV